MTPIARYIAEKEGYRERAYHCSEGYPTIGYGYKLSNTKHVPLEAYSAMRISKPVAAALLQEYINEIVNDARVKDLLLGLNQARRAALVSMAYQMGVHGLLKFKKMLTHIAAGCFNSAADEALDGKWASQTSGRAQETAEMIRTGEMPSWFK